MLTFYVAGAALLALSLVYWFMAVRINPELDALEQQALAREQLNTYRLRLRELAYLQEHGDLDEKEYESSVNDLKRQLLHDLSGQGGEAGNKQFPIFLPGLAFLVLFVGAFYSVNGSPTKLDDWQKTVALLPDLGERAVINQGDNLSPKELQQFALGLRTKLFDKGDDAVAWLLLGRVTMSLNDMESSVLAFERAYQLDPTKLAVLLSYSQVLLMETGQPSIRKAALLLSEVLRQQPQNIDALLMVGYIAERMGQQDKAIATWQMLLNLMPAKDSRLAFVQEKLGKAHNEPSLSAPVQMAKVKVNLVLGDALTGKVPAGGTLFIYAKAAAGKPMPAAVIKLSEFSFPMTVELSDAHAMLQDYKLSSLDDVIVYSRLSKDGDIGISAGELQGQTQVFKIKDTTEVTVLINKIL